MPLKDPVARSAYQSRWQRDRRDDWLAANGPCRQCGSWDELEVDHVDPDTKVDHRIWGLSEERRNAELAKCQVLCRACHRKKTNEQNGFSRHGTVAMYRNKRQGCRCDDCRAANTRAAREARQRARAS